MSLSKRLVGAVVLFGMSLVLNAKSVGATEADPLDLTIGKVTVTEVSDESSSSELQFSDRSLNSFSGLTEVAAEVDALQVVFDKVVNLGQKVWNLVEAGKPVVRTQWATANALPEGVQSWRQMSGWENPRARVYRVHFENLYGVTVADFSFRVTYLAGGNINGVGQYLSRVSVEPANLLVRWGYNFEASAEVADVVNVGSAQSPVAGMELLVKWKVSTVMNQIESTASYFVRGDGEMVDLTSGY